MEAATQRIADLVGWSARPGDLPALTLDELTAAEDALGLVFPQGYRDLVVAFPPGEFDAALTLISPYPGRPAELYRVIMDGICQVLAMGNEFVEPGYPVFPSEGGLFPWATVDGAFYVCWLYAPSADPNTWPCVVCSVELDIYYPTNRDTLDTFTALIVGELSLGSRTLINDRTSTPRFDLQPLDTYPTLG